MSSYLYTVSILLEFCLIDFFSKEKVAWGWVHAVGVEYFHEPLTHKVLEKAFCTIHYCRVLQDVKTVP